MKFRRFIPSLSLTAVFLLIEFYDELYYALNGAALPSIQTELGLDYARIGLLLGLPHLIGVLIEWILMLLGDTRLRKGLVVGGGVTIGLAALLIGSTPTADWGFWMLLSATILTFLASGAFVTLAQGSLMDLHPGKEERMMVRWSLAGSLGNLAGPVLLAGVFAAGLTWRWGYFGLAVAALLLSALTALYPFPAPLTSLSRGTAWRDEFKNMITGALSVVRSAALVRWLILLELADLMMDVFLSYAPLYFANIVKLDVVQTSLALGAMMAGSVLADLLVVPLLEIVRGRNLVRITAVITIGLYIAFLTLPGTWVKIGLAVFLRLANLGWYSIMKAEAYAVAPGRSGAVNALNSLTALISGAIPWAVGLAAQEWGLANAMWLLLLGPLTLILFVPRYQN